MALLAQPGRSELGIRRAEAKSIAGGVARCAGSAIGSELLKKRSTDVQRTGGAIGCGKPGQMDLEIEQDPLLAPLHNNPRFTALVAHPKQVAALKSN